MGLLQHATGSVKVLATWFSRWRSRSRVLMAAAAGMVLAAGVFASPAIAGTTGITLKPAFGPPTTKVSVSGTGFGASETVTVDFNSAPVATATTSSTGTFTAAFTVPKTAPPGKYPVTATGQSSGLSATAYFLVRTNWAQLRFSAAGTGFNPYENVLSTSNVGNLAWAWQEPSTLAVTNISPPSVYNGVLYTSGAANLYAINPATRAVLWTGTAGPSGSVHTPAVVNGVAYIASSDGNFYAYSTKASSANCSGTPVTCKPLWSAPIAGAGSNDQSSAVVSGGVVYVAAGYELYAFSASGCGVATCNPLWVSAGSYLDGSSTPAVSGGVIYIGGGSGLYAYSTKAGSPNCSGTPVTCKPLWVGNANGVGLSDTAPAVANGVVYLSTSPGYGTLYAFSTACPVGSTCNPLWTYTSSTAFLAFSSPAVANGKVYVNATDATLYVFSTSGSQLWTAPVPGGYSGGYGGGSPAPAVANGVVYAGYAGYVEASSASGTTNCSGTPEVCNPLWTLAGPNGGYGDWDAPIVVNGVVYAAEWNGTPLSAYKLP